MNAIFVMVTPAELAEIKADPDAVESFFDDDATPNHVRLDLEKAWHGLQYVMTGQPEPGSNPLSQIIMGGTEVGDDPSGFSGYGPARYMTPPQVAQLSQLLADEKLESLAASRFDADTMNKLELYPGFEPADAEWIMEAFRSLRSYYAQAAAQGRAIITCLV